MESYEALGNAINRKTAVHAKELGLSVSTVSKWQEPAVDFTDSGAYNPLDRVETVIETSLKLGNPHELALSPVYYLAERFNFKVYPLPQGPPNLSNLIKQLNKTVSAFGNLVHESSDALEDGVITPEERKRIEKKGTTLYAQLGLFLKQIQEAAK